MQTISETYTCSPPTRLPDSARVWIYQSNRLLSPEETEKITASGKEFAAGWAAHKVQLDSDFFILDNLFLVLAVDEASHGASGCSIDTSVKFIREVEKEFGIVLMDRMKLALKYPESWRVVTVKDLESLDIPAGMITTNNLVQTIGQMREGFYVPFVKSWAGKR